MESGAQVVLEAVQSGSAVLASRIAGNIGMLGPAHAGYVDLGDDLKTACMLARARAEPAFLALVREQTRARAPPFEPVAEPR